MAGLVRIAKPQLPVFFTDTERSAYLRRVATTMPNGNATTAAFDALNRVVTHHGCAGYRQDHAGL